MTTRKLLAPLAIVVLTSSGCGYDCEATSSNGIVVLAEEDCPSVAEAQAHFEASDSVPPFDDTVERLTEVIQCPAATVCWYRTVVDDPSCYYSSRAERLANDCATNGMYACDEQGELYGEILPTDANECPATGTPSGPYPRATFVDADVYPAKKACRYETSYTTTCGGPGAIPWG